MKKHTCDVCGEKIETYHEIEMEGVNQISTRTYKLCDSCFKDYKTRKNKEKKSDYSKELDKVFMRKRIISCSNLRKLDLRKKNLYGTNLSYMLLNEAKLQGANLEKANLDSADLFGADLSKAKLSEVSMRDTYCENANFFEASLFEANLKYAHLKKTNLRNANLKGACLEDADLRNADLRGANLLYVNFSNANLSGADLSNTDLSLANLNGANLKNANLEGTKLPLMPPVCPDTGSFIAWKKAIREDDRKECIVKLLIPEDAKRVFGTDYGCKSNKAIVLEVQSLKGRPLKCNACSIYDNSFVYRVGETVKPKKRFVSNRWDMNSSGIHYYVNKKLAMTYGLTD